MRLVTHNVYWCQGASFGTFPPAAPRAEIIAGLVALWRQWQIDLCCLQELQDTDAARQVATAASAGDWWHAPGRLVERPHYGVAILAPRGSRQAHTVQHPCLERSALRATRSRDGLTIANLHLRSNRFAPKPVADVQRLEELRAILEQGTAPDLVLGDFNARLGDAVWQELRDRGYHDAMELALPDAGPLPGPMKGDRLWLSATLRPQFRAAGTIPVEAARLPSGEGLSDHLAVWLDLAV
jgi:endonuclease/exonuclease/phosphatase family metal-dependent hydrolase